MKREDALRKEWADMQARWNAAYGTYAAHVYALEREYGGCDWAPKTKRDRLSALDRRKVKASGQVYAWLDLHFPGHGLYSGTPLAHVCGRMAFEDIPRSA